MRHIIQRQNKHGYQKSKRVYSLIPCMCTLSSSFFVLESAVVSRYEEAALNSGVWVRPTTLWCLCWRKNRHTVYIASRFLRHKGAYRFYLSAGNYWSM